VYYRNDCGATEQQPKRHAQKYAVNDDLELAVSTAIAFEFAAFAAIAIATTTAAASAPGDRTACSGGYSTGPSGCADAVRERPRDPGRSGDRASRSGSLVDIISWSERVPAAPRRCLCGEVRTAWCQCSGTRDASARESKRTLRAA
jgi:hypothetical protein